MFWQIGVNFFSPKQANLQWTPTNQGEGEQIQGKDKKFILYANTILGLHSEYAETSMTPLSVVREKKNPKRTKIYNIIKIFSVRGGT